MFTFKEVIFTDIVEFVEKIYGIELLGCQKELIRSVARLPEGSRIVMGRKGPILLDKDGKLITKRKRATYYSDYLKREVNYGSCEKV